MSPTRVLYLIDSLASGGAQRQLVTLINALDRAVIEPVVAVYHPLDHFRPELERTGTRVLSLGHRGAKDPSVLFRLAGLMRRDRFDLVHCYMRVPGILARLATCLGPSVPVVLSERNVDLGNSGFRLMLERALSARAAAVIANADAVREHVESKLPVLRGRVITVLNGVVTPNAGDDERTAARAFRAEHIGDARFLLCVVARVSEQKDPHTLLDALETLPGETLRALRVVWVGNRIDEELAGSVDERLAGSPAGSHVRFLSPRRDIATVYLACDGLLLTSRWEGLPNAVLEAMSYGLPVIATAAGGTAELVDNGRTGWLVPCGDAEALASALRGFVHATDEERSRMGAAGADFVRERCSVARLVRGTIRVYRAVLTGAAIGPVPPGDHGWLLDPSSEVDGE